MGNIAFIFIVIIIGGIIYQVAEMMLRVFNGISPIGTIGILCCGLGTIMAVLARMTNNKDKQDVYGKLGIGFFAVTGFAFIYSIIK